MMLPSLSISEYKQVAAFAGTDPAAGAEITETITTGDYYWILGIEITLVTDATAANRVVTVIIDDGTNEIFRATCGSNQTAGQTVRYILLPLHPPALTITNLVAYFPLPSPLIVGPSWRIRTSTTAIVAGDNFGAPILHRIPIALS